MDQTMIGNLIKRWQATWKPHIFQGWGKKSPYFEGWYFKLVNADQSVAIALIPGVSLHDADSHCFIQIIRGHEQHSDYHRFPLEVFVPNDQSLHLKIADSQFSEKGLEIALSDVQGAVRFGDLARWKSSLLRPGIMGWYTFIPKMQCYHGLVSMHHSLSGSLKINDQLISFDGGKGYIEKDWGSSFPKSWIWTQCNHFQSEEHLSVMASVAHIPWLGSYFIGFLAVIWLEGKMKIFTTYTGAKMKASIDEKIVKLEFRDQSHSLRVKATMAPGAELISPIVGRMAGKVNESLQSTINITYIKDTQIVVEDQGTSAGLEVAGPIDILLSDEWIQGR